MSTFKTANGTCFFLIALCLSGCKEGTNETTEPPIPIKEMVVTPTTAPTGNRYSGTVESENETALSFSSPGTIGQLNVKVGDRVRKGQPLATIDPATSRNAYDMAHATRVQAEDAYRRMKQLHDKGSLSEIKWVEAQSQLQQAVAAENIARKNLDDCTLTAPCDGIVSETNGEPGQNVVPGPPVVKLVSTTLLNVVVSVPENEIARMRIGQPASIRLTALPAGYYRGRVVEKGVIANPLSRSYSVKIRVEDNDNRLLPGMVANVTMHRDTTETAIVVPASLIQMADDNTTFVWTNEGGKAVRRPVTCGTYLPGGVSIVSGLKEGDRVICEGQQKVCTGTPVTVKQG